MTSSTQINPLRNLPKRPAGVQHMEQTPSGKRTTSALLRMLDFDFFEVLDSVTIARSRKHIEKYYDTATLAVFLKG